MKFLVWLKSLFSKKIELTIWFTSAEGKTKKVFELKRIVKIESTHVVAEDLEGKRFEISTVEPFDYYIKTIS